MIRKGIVKVWRRSAAVVLVIALTAGMCGCGKNAETEPAAEEQTAAEESASAQSTVQEPINPEQVKSEDIIKEEEAPAADEGKKAETAPATAEVKEEAAPAEAKADAAEKAEEPAAEQKESADAVTEAEEPAAKEEVKEETASPKQKDNDAKEEKKEEKKKEEKAAVDLNEVLDGYMTFDGMELQFPIELSQMKLGKWTITYEIDGSPEDKTLAPEQVVVAKMTSPDYTDNDVIVKAEFGNYTDSEAQLTDLPMTGIYITKGKGTETAEAKTPAMELPCGFTWGASEAEIREQLGEASLSGSFEYEFDFMYENGQYLIELAGMGDTGLEYVVYSVE